MKRKTTKELLAESFRELAQQKSIDKITVQEITENCGYSPATFYRQFKDKYHLIAWEYAEGTAEVLRASQGQDYSLRQTLLNGARRYLSEKDYLVNLLQHTAGHDSFVQYMAEINYDQMQKHIREVSGREALTEQEKLYLRIYCFGTTCLTCEWLLDKFRAAPEELAELFENSLPAPLKGILILNSNETPKSPGKT